MICLRKEKRSKCFCFLLIFVFFCWLDEKKRERKEDINSIIERSKRVKELRLATCCLFLFFCGCLGDFCVRLSLCFGFNFVLCAFPFFCGDLLSTFVKVDLFDLPNLM